MAKRKVPILSGQILEEDTEVTLAQLCETCTVQTEIVEAMVNEGIVAPTGNRSGHWCFARSSVKRVRVALRLQRDLGVNLAGAALVLDLLDRVEQLRARLGTLEPRRRR
ncbi:MAG: chaperone modulator CbpM [Acidiferrobacterales bacterium]